MPARFPRPRPDDGEAGSRQAGRASSFGRATKLLAGFLGASVGAGVLVAGIAAPAVIAAGQTSNETVEAFNSLPASLEQPPLSQQSRILYSDGTPMATFYYENRILVPLDKVAPIMQKAIVDIEDNRFFDHGGVDPRGLARAFVQNSQGGDVQGASTLTQQWIKNVQVEEALSALPTNASVEERQKAFNEVTVRSGVDGYVRKLREMKLAIAAEKKFPKEQILENYLNIANFGGGQYGVEAASEHWFNKPAAELDLPQAALLAGIVQNPVGYDPVRNPQDAQGRRDTVLGRMLQLGTITQAEHDAAVAVPIAQMLNVQKTPNGCEQAGQAGFFCDYVVKQFRDDDAFGGTKEQRLRQLYRGGLTITTTLDSGKQQAAFEEVANSVPAQDSTVPTNIINKEGKVQRTGGTSNLGASIVSVEPGTGKIVAMAQNRTYSTSPDAPLGATAINYNTDYLQGGSSGFQPGSNFKPFVLAQWLTSGRTLNATVNATQRDYPNSSWKYGSCYSGSGYQGKAYGPGNAGDGEDSGTLPVLVATYKSVNTGYAAMENQLNLCDVGATAQALGMHKAKADDRNITRQVSTDINVTPSMMLGVDEVAPLTVATAYAAFAAQGNYCTPLAIAKITDADGKDLPVKGPQCTQAISKEVANGINYALQRVLTDGTAAGKGLAGGREAAGKTGTTNNSVATWFTGYTPQLATSVWIGVPEKSMSINGARIAGRTYTTMYGGTVAAPMWRNYMNRALEGAPEEEFVDPPQSIIGRPPAPPRPTPSPGDGGGATQAPGDGQGQGGDQGGQPGDGGDQGGQPGGGGDQGGGQGGPGGGNQNGGQGPGGGQGGQGGGNQGTTVEPAPAEPGGGPAGDPGTGQG
ncbi:Membrane carboxypeptidase (penicillin-binding protein) [Quadrisphaera granulorum]|uniref:Membrane peptidoglycan carboxypeptidase n=1 Tax=Quadrisphaera granulorum TaxID=317664 RepID=A0A316A7D3_9ACTN|nr:transglycosylase domain-containing protein [Quadrisphaera granulorum]PWJ53359.1 membrane peptidoglycan carboxypeptidase [Quadrisphaera granulorum]SZE97033.1 Membrane carboxypeptidase (penicillin-binding protein) [Quadrisphaera granulorum]